jgi:hypothetical protein
MPVGDELRLRIEESRRELHQMTPQESLAAAALLRDVKPILETDRQRELAEELAGEFEARAAAQPSRSQS